MSGHTKHYSSEEEFNNAIAKMSVYQRMHNVIRQDFQILLSVTETKKDDEKVFDALYRSCLKGLFSMFESDIYGLNQIETYPDYKDGNSFNDKFKKTFKQVGITWNKQDICRHYIDTKWAEVRQLRNLRNEIMHPKEMAHLHKGGWPEFERLKKVFTDYDDFINAVMNDFFVGMSIPFF